MSKLILKEFTCIDESDENDSDSPYFLIFVGRPATKKSDVFFVRREAWDNDTDAGERKPVNMTIAENVGTDTVVLAALLEEDVDPDVAGPNRMLVESFMVPAFQDAAAGSASAKQIADKIKPEFNRAIGAIIENDELLGIKHVPIPASSGDIELLRYRNDGANYSVRFAVS